MNTSLQQSKSSKDSILNYLLKNDRASAQNIADYVKISIQATRKHLKVLEEMELIQHQLIPAKVGRPQHIYSLSRQGRDRFPQNYGEFAVSFLDTITETIGEKEVSKILAKQWQKKVLKYQSHLTADNLEEKIKQLVEIRRQEGYMAEVYPVNKEKENKESKRTKPSSSSFFVTEHNCAISDVAESYPQVCTHELEMFVALFPDCQVERTNWMNNGEHLCGYLIRASTH